MIKIIHGDINYASLSKVAKDYYELTKPKVVQLILLTALVGMALSQAQWPNWPLVIFALLGIGLLASAAAVINHLVDSQIDAQMARTHSRPIAKGRIKAPNAMVFAFLLSVSGLYILSVKVNILTAALTFSSLLGYALIYTFYLKRATPQNIVIGGLAGALPPLLGWTAITNSIDANALLLVMLIFTWTPPHFWALAIHREKDYAKVNIPMLPVTHGIAFTKTMVVLYSVLLWLVGLLPWLFSLSSYIYLSGALVLNSYFLYLAIRLKFSCEQGLAMKLFRFSIYHLMLLFIFLLADHYLL